MDTEFIRDCAMYAAIFGFFAMSWFGWAQEKPPKSWVVPLIIFSIASGLVALAGGILAFFNWDAASALSNSGAMRQYGIIVGIEFGIAGIGAALLIIRKLQRFISPWVAFIVGVHFFALAGLFADPWIYLLASLGTLFAIASVPIARAYKISTSAVCGLLTGLLLLAFAVRGLLLFFL